MGNIPIKDNVYDRDRNYWNKYYKKLLHVELKPSDFAHHLYENGILKSAYNLLDLGCGNGRDSLFFLHNGLKVTGIDASDFAIEKLKSITKNDKRARFLNDDFVNSKILHEEKFDCIYSRWTWHAITEYQENRLLENIKVALNPNGRLFIEARTVNDDLYGKGVPVEVNSFIYNQHYRRFIDITDLSNKLQKMGFKIISLQEKRGFSPSLNSNPVLFRAVATID